MKIVLTKVLADNWIGTPEELREMSDEQIIELLKEDVKSRTR